MPKRLFYGLVSAAVMAMLVFAFMPSPARSNAAMSIKPLVMMMNGGMHHHSMMTAPASGASANNPVDERLITYIRDNNLACLSCHAIQGRGAGPSFVRIMDRYSGKNGSGKRLLTSIVDGVSGQWPGYPPMPGGLANADQARHLVRLILSLRNH
ncbi:c-type cytochrome [Acidihalobacter prosperus]